MRNQKGITLVALVITIVVLLILAGVTISMVLGPNGVLSNANTAKKNSAKSTAQDALSTALSSVTTDIYAGNEVKGANKKYADASAIIADAAGFKAALEMAAPGYTFTVNNNKTITVTSKTNSAEKYTATITDELNIKDFTEANS